MAIKQQNIAPFDTDAQRFILAAGLTRLIDKRAINYLVISLKSNGLWTKFNTIYPMVGGNKWSCKFNLINPRDADSAFRLTWVASPSISYNGVDWDGTTQYARTYVIASTVLSSSSLHLSYYSRENTQSAAGLDMGAQNGATSQIIILNCGRTNGNLTFFEQGGSWAFSSAGLSRAGFFIGTRTASGAASPTVYRNGVSLATGVSDGTTSALPAFEILLGAYTNGVGVASNFSNRQCAFASMGSGLAASEAFIFSQIVQQFQIILNRAV